MAGEGKIEMALDDIIKQTRGGRGRRGGGRGGGRGAGGIRVRGGGVGGRMNRGGGMGQGRLRALNAYSLRTNAVPEGRWLHDKYDNNSFGGGGLNLRTGSGGGASVNATTKLLITNLEYGVTDSDLQELFSEFGPLRRAAVHYDKTGRSLGSADVVFERRTDAMRAVKQYDSVPLDGRPMKIQVVNSNSRQGGGGDLSTLITLAGGGNRPMRRGIGMGRRGSGGGGGGIRVGRGGRGRGGGGGGGGKQSKKTPTQAELDAELDAYVNKME